MNRSPPQPQMAVTIAMETYTKLCAASSDTGYQKEVWEIASEAVRDWLVRNAPDSFDMPTISGVQWKDVFLPSGTLLRTIFQGKNYHAIVEGDKLLHDGEATSPSRFANGVGGAGRNAWKVIWVLFPKTTTWKLAQTLRQARPVRTVKKAIISDEPRLDGRRTGSAAARPGGSALPAARQATPQVTEKPAERRHQRHSGLGHLRRAGGKAVADELVEGIAGAADAHFVAAEIIDGEVRARIGAIRMAVDAALAGTGRCP